MRRNYWRSVILLVFDNSKYFMKKMQFVYRRRRKVVAQSYNKTTKLPRYFYKFENM